MLNSSASLAMSTSVLKALPGKLDIKKDTHLVFSIYPPQLDPIQHKYRSDLMEDSLLVISIKPNQLALMRQRKRFLTHRILMDSSFEIGIFHCTYIGVSGCNFL